ncbi:serpin family protein [Alkalicoccus chagannorensis]|uniref:serpin family protein n=1 Tax=Alkalicoccus chagannorensis TaxID=427072 RepID=UPI0004289D28|nr:serpin family protein [Alkalicoccus chagannorensis]
MAWKTSTLCSGTMILGALLAACGENTDSELEEAEPDNEDPASAEAEEETYEAADVDEEVPRAARNFGWDLFEETLEEEENGLVSPISISTALSMTMAGADGDTREEMAEVLALHDVDEEDIHASFQAWMHVLEEADPDTELSIANSIWKEEEYPFEDAFIQKLETYYEAQVEPLTDEEPINEWISEQTNGLIEDMIDEVPETVVMYLINAVYFQGDWTEPFEESMTQEQTFTTSTEEKVDAMMMMHAEKEPTYDYSEEDAFQAVSLPYGEEEAWSMNVILPNEDEGSLEQTIDFLREEGPPSFEEKTGMFRLPRFTMEQEMELNDPLQELGMTKAFNGGEADFSRMAQGGGPSISEVLHDTFIEVDETGTEAAAATSVAMEESEPAHDFEMVVDRPFLFTIQDEETEAPLFIGYVNEPEE